MSCELCSDTKKVARLRSGMTKICDVSCPRCVRRQDVIGSHETLRGRTRIWQPGERIDALEN